MTAEPRVSGGGRGAGQRGKTGYWWNWEAAWGFDSPLLRPSVGRGAGGVARSQEAGVGDVRYKMEA